MFNLDRLAELGLRGLAHRTSRRSGLFGRLGLALVGGGSLPLLPVARAAPAQPNRPPAETTGNPQDPGDTLACDYWRYCAIDGFLCGCCGGATTKCPPGSEMSALTWIGTCHNPADDRNYIISYNDCCGISACGRCFCNTNQNERPITRPQSNNDVDWCTGTSSTVYVCSTAVIIGVAAGK